MILAEEAIYRRIHAHFGKRSKCFYIIENLVPYDIKISSGCALAQAELCRKWLRSPRKSVLRLTGICIRGSVRSTLCSITKKRKV